jgi:ATP-binding cassette subfamily C protein
MRAVDFAILSNKIGVIEESKNILLIALLLLSVNILLAYIKGLYKRKAMVESKINYVSGVFDKNINEFQRDNNAKYISYLTNDMNTLELNYVDGIFEICHNFIYFLVSFIVIATISPMALGIGIGISFLTALISVLLSKPLQKHQTQRSDMFEGYTSYIKEVLSAFHIIKANNLNDKVKSDFQNKSSDIQQKGFIIEKIYTYIIALQNLITSGSMFAITGIVAYMSIKGLITLGGVILIINNIGRVMFPLMEIAEWLPKVFSVKTLFVKLDKSLENADNHIETKEIDSFEMGIKFRDISFSYEDNLVLENINLEINKGEKYLIVGPSGGGKSTLLKLLRKYFLPNSGEIYFDNMNLKDIKKESYFKHISNVEQQVFLFEDTVKNNITLYKDYKDDEIDLSIKRAGLDNFIKGQKQGLDTMILENGKNISGGEKSRIAIARGLLANSRIIFLDEAFASLDSKVAREIEDTLLSLEGITVVNVSHVVFKETRDKYDKVFVVNDKMVTGSR